MTGRRAWLALALAAGLLAAGGAARADTAPAAGASDETAAAPAGGAPSGEGDADDPLAGGAAPEFVDPSFGPRYVIEQIVVRGNRKTRGSIILAELEAAGLAPGVTVDASDARVEAARFRLLALGHFLDARLALARGAHRGGAVLLVEVEERGTFVINELYPSSSAATEFWGGADVSETNFLGRGVNLGGGFVVSTKPRVPAAEAGLGLRLHASLPERQGPGGVGLGGTALYNDASEFYRDSGADSDADPGRFTAVGTRRAGGILSASKTVGHAIRASVDVRGESVRATLPAIRTRVFPDGTTAPIDFDARPGDSRVATVALTLDYDTRSDPVLPRSGARVVGTIEAGGPVVGSSYSFGKALAQASFYARMPHGHALGVHLLGGAIVGEAPYFDRFFIGDLNVLLPRRALGIDFSTQPSPNLLGTTIARHRFDDYAARVVVEYAVPVWRRRGFVYGGDAFAAVGLLGMASDGDLDPPGPFRWSNLPVDLTADLGLRLDTYIGIFTISIANALSRSSF
jgi:outer membrane protein insertion porin family